jgi:serine/threonine-protein kinase
MGAATQTVGRTAAIPPYAYGPEQAGLDGEQPRRKIWPWVTIAVVVIVLIAAILGLKFLSGGNNSGGVAVPAVAGSPLKTAESTLTHDGFKIGTITRHTSPTVPKNYVISTNPSGTAPRGSKINLLVSSGSSTVAVPYVQGDTLGEAKQALAAKGLKWTVSYSATSAPAGTAANVVVTQSPAANTVVPKGSSVTLILPPKGQPMPGLVGQNVQQAINTLESPPYSLNQSQISVQNCSSPGFQPNYVCRTSPAQGQPLQPGATVVLYVVPASQTPTPTVTPTSPSPTPTSPSPTNTPGGGGNGH